MSIPKLEALEDLHNEVMLRVLRVYMRVTVAEKPQTLPPSSGSLKLIVYIGFEFEPARCNSVAYLSI